MKKRLQRALFRYGYDTRCRNLMTARLLRSIPLDGQLRPGPAVLDVGCGSFGVATFLKGIEVVGVDKRAPESEMRFPFQRGDVTALPFLDRSFALVSSVDVLENLPLGIHEQAIKELVRVASKALLIACPHGQTARECDEAFLRACRATTGQAPDWLSEHQKENYPEVTTVSEQILQAAIASGRTARLSVSYCEPASVCRLIRGAAARSRWLYAAANLFFGAMLKFLPVPGPGNSYRMIILAELLSTKQAA